MKKLRIVLSILFAACVAILPACFAGCRSVLPMAHVYYKTENEQYVQYTSHMSSGYAHIFVYDNETQVPDSENYEQPLDYYNACVNACVMYFSFKRNLGSENIKDTKVLDVDIEGWYSIRLVVKKSSGSYGADKQLYINGKALKVEKKYDSISETEYTKTFYFEDFGLKRANTNGQENNFINIIEYK